MRRPELWGCGTEDTTFSFPEPQSHVLKEEEAPDFPRPHLWPFPGPHVSLIRGLFCKCFICLPDETESSGRGAPCVSCSPSCLQ